jgi:hypothetical protein
LQRCGDWISIEQLDYAWKHLNDAILTARINVGRSADDFYIWQVAHQLDIYTSNPITACQEADAVIWGATSALVPDYVVVEKGIEYLVFIGSAAWGFPSVPTSLRQF